uniref:Transmembrane protein 243, mitochondrial a n=1 Tax=Esox lucius TaxID=8010 RepID=A0A3P8ZW91_ESOLU
MDDFTANDFTTRTYGTSGLDNRPLFGETSARDRAINLLVGGLTSLLVVVTVISSFLFPSLPPWPLNIFFAFCILMTCGSVMVLIGATEESGRCSTPLPAPPTSTHSHPPHPAPLS